MNLKDVDECRSRTYSCDQGSKCQNTVGSYSCTKSCGMGYLFNAIIVQCQGDFFRIYYITSIILKKQILNFFKKI
jgi:hypothetical protein